jgi:hypothetical protein
MFAQTRIAVSLTIVLAGVAGLLVCLVPMFMPTTAPQLGAPDADAVHVTGSVPKHSGRAPGAARIELRRPPSGDDDGELPDGVTVFDTSHAGVTRLDPDLLRALRRAATDAPSVLYVTSGWRSPAYQERLLEQAAAKYGSRAEAARWVATPARSAHVSGDAVDLGGADAVAWLARHGAAYGLCQVYANEPWHFELATGGSAGCPAMYADPTQDPRLR